MRSTSHRPARLLLFFAALTLAGCADGPGSRHVVRVHAEGHEVFHSRARLLPTRARFECRASDSGRCHYAVFGGVCGSLASILGDGVVRCNSGAAPNARFSLEVGERRQVEGLPWDYRHCASAGPEPVSAGCLQDAMTGK